MDNPSGKRPAAKPDCAGSKGKGHNSRSTGRGVPPPQTTLVAGGWGGGARRTSTELLCTAIVAHTGSWGRRGDHRLPPRMGAPPPQSPGLAGGGQRGGSREGSGMDSHRKAACATAKVVGRRGGAGGAAQVWKGSESHREGAPYARRNQDEAGCQRTGGTVRCGLCDQGGAARAERVAPRLARLKWGGASATMSYLMVSRHRRPSSPPMAATKDSKHPTRHPS